MKIFNIYGPNLNMLGYRNKNIYGDLNFVQLNEQLQQYTCLKSMEYNYFQSNYEGAIIDYIHEIVINEQDQVALILNLGAYTHYSHAIADALEICKDKHVLVEVHISDVKNRESFRKISVIERLKPQLFYGKGIDSYKEAID